MYQVSEQLEHLINILCFDLFLFQMVTGPHLVLLGLSAAASNSLARHRVLIILAESFEDAAQFQMNLLFQKDALQYFPTWQAVIKHWRKVQKEDINGYIDKDAIVVQAVLGRLIALSLGLRLSSHVSVIDT